MPSTCAWCGIGFTHWQDYKEHTLTHKVAKHDIKPLNITGRSKKQIVEDAEASWLSPLLVTSSDELEHVAACRCSFCWNKLADKLIKEQEKEIGL